MRDLQQQRRRKRTRYFSDFDEIVYSPQIAPKSNKGILPYTKAAGDEICGIPAFAKKNAGKTTATKIVEAKAVETRKI